MGVFQQIVSFRIREGNKEWLCSAVYASLTPSMREGLWQYMMHFRSSVNIPWFLVGDFNQILIPSKAKGCTISTSRAASFAHAIDVCDLMDIGLVGNSFTWVRRESGCTSMMKRLDRALATLSWRHLFPEAYVEVLGKLHYDHFPLLLRCGGQIVVKGDRPFRFLAAWATHPEFDKVVRAST